MSCKPKSGRTAFSGLGLEVSIESGLPKVVPVAGGPAAAAGVLAGDVVTELDGSPLQGLTLGQVVAKMRRLIGSRASLCMSSTVCWSWDARTPSVSPEYRRGLGYTRPPCRSMQQRRARHCNNAARGTEVGGDRPAQLRVTEGVRNGCGVARGVVPLRLQEPGPKPEGEGV